MSATDSSTPPYASRFDLLDYRRRTAAAYAEVRSGTNTREVRMERFRATKDRLFRDHPASPLSPEERRSFAGISYYDFQPSWRTLARVDLDVDPAPFDIELGDDDGCVRLERAAVLRFEHEGRPLQLTAYWLRAYGGGLFVPFRDATTGAGSYGGGRYLLDTVKHADLGSEGNDAILDFNYAYNPSCAYSPRWTCPLAPRENTLPVAVEAGERDPSASRAVAP